MKKISLLIYLLLLTCMASAQQLFFAKTNYTDSVAFEYNIPLLAKQIIAKYREADQFNYYSNLARLQIVAKDYPAVQHSLNQAQMGDSVSNKAFGFPYALYSEIMISLKNKPESFEAVYRAVFEAKYKSFSYDEKGTVNYYSGTDLATINLKFGNNIKAFSGKDSLSLPDAITLCRSYCSKLIFNHNCPNK